MKNFSLSECQNSTSLPFSWPRSSLLRRAVDMISGSLGGTVFCWTTLSEGAITTSALCLSVSISSDEPRNKLSANYFRRQDLTENLEKLLTHSESQHLSADQHSWTTKNMHSCEREMIVYSLYCYNLENYITLNTMRLITIFYVNIDLSLSILHIK